MEYKHTQIGQLMIITLVLLIFYFGYILTLTMYDQTVSYIIIIVMLLIASFATLTVTINEKYLRIKFGYGIFSKRFDLQDIISANAVKNHWYYGWGIRLWFWPRMVIFNVSGFDAVEIRLQNGKIYRIGTDDPQGLESALKKSIR